MRKLQGVFWAMCVLATLAVRFAVGDDTAILRTVVSLDGTWQIAEGSLDSQPASLDRKSVV